MGKRAIVWALAERRTAESQACISSALKDVADIEGLRQAFSELVGIYYRLFLRSGDNRLRRLLDVNVSVTRESLADQVEVFDEHVGKTNYVA